MTSRRIGIAAAAVVERFAVIGVRKNDLETSRVLAPTLWGPALEKCPPPGPLAMALALASASVSASPRTFRCATQVIVFPFSVQEIQRRSLCFSTAEKKEVPGKDEALELNMKVVETRKILRHVNAVALQKRLNSDPRDSFSYQDLLDLIKEYAIGASDEEAMRYARALDEAGVVLIFRQNVYLHPERVAKLVAHALPFAVVPPNDPRRKELMKLEEQKAKIDALAHRQVRRFLWIGLVALTCQGALFFRLTFWELSWDVMEPIAFFVTSAGLIGGYTYFLITARDPSYRDFMQRLFLSKQMKLFKRHNFDYLRYQLLRRQCQCLDPDDRDWL